MRNLLCVMLAASAISRGKSGEGDKSPAPTAPPPAARPAAPAPVPPARPAVAPPVTGDVTALLTEEKIKGYVTYQREIAGMAGDAFSVGMNAYAKGKGDQKKFEKEMAKDERTKKLAEVGENALKKSGLTQAEISALTPVLSKDDVTRMMAADSAKALEQAKQKGKPGILGDMHKKQVEEGEQARTAFGAKYGKAALAAADKYEKDYIETTSAMMKAVFKPKK